MSLRAHRRLSTLIVLFVAFLAGTIALALVIGTAGRPARENPVGAASPPPRDVPAPKVMPTIFADETPDGARISNARLPLEPGPPPPALPFHYRGIARDRTAAEACLAAAVLYEAGDDREGEQAVAQVVLNRLRHPAFPKTVCGVVFQGSERRTGCQFTFTCDGALGRPVGLEAWRRAQVIARNALDGAVYRPVGTATHYHTDWVVPYWRSSLAKIAVVHTQIFYRWRGWWGTPAAFSGRLQPGEPLDPHAARLAGIDGALIAAEGWTDPRGPLAKPLTIAGVPPGALNGSIVRLADEEAGQFVLQLGAAARPQSFVITAFNICGTRDNCMVFGWTGSDQLPRALPVLPVQMRTLAFLYRKSSLLGIAQSYWDCRRFPRALPTQCLGTR